VRELIALAKAKPGQLNFAIGAVGSSLHMAGEAFKMQSGVDIVNIPYKGTSPAVQDLLAGQVQLMFAAVGNVKAHIQAGKLKALGVTTARRLPAFPNVPAIAEALPGYESSAWFGLFGPARLPADRVAQAQRRRAPRAAAARHAQAAGHRRRHCGGQFARAVHRFRAERDHALGQGRQVLRSQAGMTSMAPTARP
jgi:tripartite-type tricarboxylate transporter receptor subunit TctC